MGKEFNSQMIFWVYQHGRRFIVLEHQYGRCENALWAKLFKKQVLSDI